MHHFLCVCFFVLFFSFCFVLVFYWRLHTYVRRVLEVGAGCGLPGIVAAHLSPAHILLTDAKLPTITLLQSNITLNGTEMSRVCAAAQLDWVKPLEQHASAPLLLAERFDVVIASEVFN